MILPVSSLLFNTDEGEIDYFGELFIEKYSRHNIYIFSSKEHPARIELKLNNNDSHYMIVKGAYRDSEKANLIELRFTSMINSFVRFLPKGKLMSLPTVPDSLYSIVMAKDNYMMEHLQGNLSPLKDLSEDYLDLAVLNGMLETQRKENYLDNHTGVNNIQSRGIILTYCQMEPYGFVDHQARSLESYAFWAVMSYVIGIGDRHLSNILLNLDDSTINFVDFELIMRLGLK